MRIAESGTISDGLSTIVFPRTSAFGMLQCGTMLGKLNGTIDATTPTGVRSVRHSTPRLTSRTAPVAICGSEQANSVSSIALSHSARASDMTLPCSSTMSALSSSRCRSMSVR